MKSTFFSFVFIGFLISAFSGYGQSQNTIVLKPGPEKGKDTYVWSLDANTPNGGSSIIIANAWTWQSMMGKIWPDPPKASESQSKAFSHSLPFQ